MTELRTHGFDGFFENLFEPFARKGLRAARVAAADRSSFLLMGLGDPVLAELSGRWRYEDFGGMGRPAVGDWAAVHTEGTLSIIEALLPRKSLFVRKAAGRRSTPQPIAANVDTIMVVTDVGTDFSPRRLERYAAAAISGGAEPVVVINKVDLPHDRASLLAATSEVLPQALVLFTSTVEDGGPSELTKLMTSGRTYALVGSSGVGKSSLLNAILGRDRQITTAVRESDGKGRHATTRRELVVTPTGAIVIDTPGMREFGILDAQEGVAEIFGDIEELAQQCRFRDCSHHGEPGCRIEEAAAEGLVPDSRIASWLELRDELARNESRMADRDQGNAKRRWKSINKDARRMRKMHSKLGLKDR